MGRSEHCRLLCKPAHANDDSCPVYTNGNQNPPYPGSATTRDVWSKTWVTCCAFGLFGALSQHRGCGSIGNDSGKPQEEALRATAPRRQEETQNAKFEKGRGNKYRYLEAKKDVITHTNTPLRDGRDVHNMCQRSKPFLDIRTIRAGDELRAEEGGDAEGSHSATPARPSSGVFSQSLCVILA